MDNYDVPVYVPEGRQARMAEPACVKEDPGTFSIGQESLPAMYVVVGAIQTELFPAFRCGLAEMNDFHYIYCVKEEGGKALHHNSSGSS